MISKNTIMAALKELSRAAYNKKVSDLYVMMYVYYNNGIRNSDLYREVDWLDEKTIRHTTLKLLRAGRLKRRVLKDSTYIKGEYIYEISEKGSQECYNIQLRMNNFRFAQTRASDNAERSE